MAAYRTTSTPILGAGSTSTRPAQLDDGAGVREGDVLDAARSGDQAAWEQIYRQLGPPLTRYAASRGIPDPEDVTQDVMYAAAEHIHRFTGGWENLRSWLFTIAYRRCVDYHRRRHRSPEKPTDQPPEHVDPHHGADTDIWADGDAREAVAALDILTERERDIVTFRIIGEMGTRDVADALGLSRTNVRVIQSRALAKMRRYLEGNGGFLDKRFRSVSAPAAMALQRMAVRLRDLGEALPTANRIGAWVETIRGASTKTPSGLAAADAGALAGIAATTALAHSFAAVIIAAGALIGGIIAPPPPPDSMPETTVRHETAPTKGAVDQGTVGTDSPTLAHQRRPRPGIMAPAVPTLPSGELILLTSAAAAASDHIDALGDSLESIDNLDVAFVADVAELPRPVDEATERLDDWISPHRDDDGLATPSEVETIDAETVEPDTDGTSTTVTDKRPDRAVEQATDLTEDTFDGVNEAPLLAELGG